MVETRSARQPVQHTVPALDRASNADEFDERDGLVAGETGLPSRVAEAPKDLRYMAKKTWLFLCITTLLNIHNTIDGGTGRAPSELTPAAARSSCWHR